MPPKNLFLPKITPIVAGIEYPPGALKRDDLTAGLGSTGGPPAPLSSNQQRRLRRFTTRTFPQSASLPPVYLPYVTNDCYRNSALTVLFNLAPFRHFLNHVGNREGASAPWRRFNELLTSYWDTSLSADAHTTDIQYRMQQWFSRLTNNAYTLSNSLFQVQGWSMYIQSNAGNNDQQADPLEFISYMLERGVASAELHTHDAPLLERLFRSRWQQRRAYHCACSEKVRAQQVPLEFWSLEVPQIRRDRSLADMIVAAHVHDAGHGKRSDCPTCGAKDIAYDEYIKMTYFPEVMIVGLGSQGNGEPMNGQIPEFLDFSSLLDYPLGSGGADSDNADIRPTGKYQLQSVIGYYQRFSAGNNSGHYNAHLRQADNTWTRIDDFDVDGSVSTPGLVLGRMQPRGLFYVQIHQGFENLVARAQGVAVNQITTTTPSVPRPVPSSTAQDSSQVQTQTVSPSSVQQSDSNLTQQVDNPDTSDWTVARWKTQFKSLGISQARVAIIQQFQDRFNLYNAANDDGKLDFLTKDAILGVVAAENVPVASSSKVDAIKTAIRAHRQANPTTQNTATPPIQSDANSVTTPQVSTPSNQATQSTPTLVQSQDVQQDVQGQHDQNIQSPLDAVQTTSDTDLLSRQLQDATNNALAWYNNAQTLTLERDRLQQENTALRAQLTAAGIPIATSSTVQSANASLAIANTTNAPTTGISSSQIDVVPNSQPDNITLVPDSQPENQVGTQTTQASDLSSSPRILKVTITNVLEEPRSNTFLNEYRYIALPTYHTGQQLTTRQWIEVVGAQDVDSNFSDTHNCIRAYVFVKNQDGGPDDGYLMEVDQGVTVTAVPTSRVHVELLGVEAAQDPTIMSQINQGVMTITGTGTPAVPQALQIPASASTTTHPAQVTTTGSNTTQDNPQVLNSSPPTASNDGYLTVNVVVHAQTHGHGSYDQTYRIPLPAYNSTEVTASNVVVNVTDSNGNFTDIHSYSSTASDDGEKCTSLFSRFGPRDPTRRPSPQLRRNGKRGRDEDDDGGDQQPPPRSSRFRRDGPAHTDVEPIDSSSPVQPQTNQTAQTTQRTPFRSTSNPLTPQNSTVRERQPRNSAGNTPFRYAAIEIDMVDFTCPLTGRIDYAAYTDRLDTSFQIAEAAHRNTHTPDQAPSRPSAQRFTHSTEVEVIPFTPLVSLDSVEATGAVRSVRSDRSNSSEGVTFAPDSPLASRATPAATPHAARTNQDEGVADMDVSTVLLDHTAAEQSDDDSIFGENSLSAIHNVEDMHVVGENEIEVEMEDGEVAEHEVDADVNAE